MTTLSIVSPGLNYSNETLQLQKDLNTLGYSITIDGLFGPETQNAVMSFQQSVGIEVDGVAGPITLSEIQTATQTTLQMEKQLYSEWPSETRYVDRYQPTNGDEPSEIWPPETRYIYPTDITMPEVVVTGERIIPQLASIDWKWILLGIGIVMIVTQATKKR